MEWQSTLKFINEDASSVHGAVRVSSIFTSESGEWKLGGFDILSSINDDDAVIYVGYSSRQSVQGQPMLTARKDVWQLSTRLRSIQSSGDQQRRVGNDQTQPSGGRRLLRSGHFDI